MPTGRKPVPAEVRRARGEAPRPLPVVVGGRVAPPRPDNLTPEMKAAWNIAIEDLTHGEAIDHADGMFLEGLVVMVGRAREMRAYAKGKDVIIASSQGPVLSRVLHAEREYWTAARAFLEGVPLSPWGRARLGLKSKPPADQVAQDIGLPPRLRAVGDGE